MNFSVMQKALAVIILPLLIQVSLIGTMSWLISETDRETSLEAQRQQFTIDYSRMVFSDFNAAVLLTIAWKEKDSKKLQALDSDFSRIKQSAKRILYLPPDENPKLNELCETCMRMQGKVLDRFNRIVKVSANGFTLDSLSKVLQYQKDLMSDMTKIFETAGKMRNLAQKVVSNGRKKMALIAQTETALLAGACLANLLAAVFVFAFFQRHFVKRIAVIKDNTRRITDEEALIQPLSGQDEIARLDKAFHEMHKQFQLILAREKALFTNSSGVICIVSAGKTIRQINPACLPVLGTARENFLEKQLPEILPSAFWQVCSKALDSCRINATPMTFQTGFRKADGTEIQLQWSAIWSSEQDSWYCIIRDVSEENRLEKTKQALLELLSSDFRLPLKRLKQNFEGLQNGQFGKLAELACKKIESSKITLDRLVLLVDELLQLGQLQTDEMKLNFEIQDIEELLKQSVNDLSSFASSREIDIQLECPHGLSWKLDKYAIIRVLVNLISNAIKFSPDNARIIVKAEEEENEEGRQLFISVCDKGKGIAQSKLAELFRPFQQVNAADGQRGKGSGLGLAISKKIVEQHKGRIGAVSTENEGSTFSFKIPADPEAANASIAAEAKPAAAPASSVIREVATAPDTLHENANVKLISTVLTKKNPNPIANLNLKKKAWLLVGIPLTFQLIFALPLAQLSFESRQELLKLFQSRATVNSAVEMTMNVYSAALMARAASRLLCSFDDYEKINSELDSKVEAFHMNARKDPNAAVFASSLEKELASIAPITAEVKRLARSAPSSEETRNTILKLLLEAGKLSKEVERMIDSYEKTDTVHPEKLSEIREKQSILLMAGMLFSIAITIGLCMFFSRDISARLLMLLDNSIRFPQAQPLHDLTEGADEIAQLDRSFHEMAGRLLASRAKESAFLDYSSDFICSLDEETRFLSANQALKSALRLSNQALTEARFSNYLPHGLTTSFQQALAHAKENEAGMQVETAILVEEKNINLHCTISYSSSESAYFCIAQDISERKEMDKLKKEFASVITHDLRTPLATILGTLGLLQANAYGESPQEALEVLDKCELECQQVLELINDYLDIQKLESGHFKLQDAKLDLYSVTDHSIELVYDKESEAAVTLKKPDAAISIVADSERFSQALCNILLELCREHDWEQIITLSSQEQFATLGICCRNSQNDAASVQVLLDAFNSKLDISAESSRSGGRLRIPLAKRILEAHFAILGAAANPEGELCISIKFPLQKV